MNLLRFTALSVLLLAVSVESFIFGKGPKQLEISGILQQPSNPQAQQSLAPYNPFGQGNQQIQFAPPGPQQIQSRPQGSQQNLFPPQQNQNVQGVSAQFQYGFPPPGQGGQSLVPFNPRIPPTFRPMTTSPTPIPFQALNEAQPVKIPFKGIPPWMLKLFLLYFIKQSVDVTTATTTTSEAPYTFPPTYEDWYKYGNCAYKSSTTPQTWDQAKTECENTGARLATINVKQSETRSTIFGQTSLSTGVAWVGLYDQDGSTTPFLPQWLDFAVFVPGASPPSYSTSAGTRSCAKVGTSDDFAFADCDSEKQKYICEFCPSVH